MQANQAKIQGEIELEQTRAQLRIQQLQEEMKVKKELMQMEFDLSMKVKEMEAENTNSKETNKEDRKDERTKILATQQSELIDQRNNGKAPKNFESAGNDNIGGAMNMVDSM
jgi:RNase P/RNase MRP subunit p29